MTPTLSLTIWIAITAAALFAAWWDISSSLDFWKYGQKEAISWHADKYGFFSVGKSLRTLAVFVALSTGALIYALLTEPLYAGFAAVPMVPIIFNGLIFGTDNRKHARANREEQIWNLNNDFPDLKKTFQGFEELAPLDGEGGRYRYRLFPWVYVEPLPQGMTEKDLRPIILAELRAAAKLPRSTWFTDEWFALTGGNIKI